MSTPFPDLVALFDALPAPTIDPGLGRFCAQPITGFPACAIGKDSSGNPVLLIQADNAQPGTAAPLVLEHLSVIHLAPCRVKKPESDDQNLTLSVIRCTDSERAFREFFLRSLHPVIVSLPAHPSRQQITDAIERLVALFRQIAEAPRKTIAGLWAELLVMARARHPARLLMSWHALPEERFDFVSGAERIDVKAASGGMRIHHFSLEQIRPAAGTQVVIISVLIERMEGGSSVADLVDRIRARLSDHELLIRLDSVVAQTIGQDWRSMQEAHFDLQLAISSLRFLDAADIPSVPIPLPAEVTGVHFRVDLSQHAMPFPAALICDGTLFQAALPE